MEAEQQVRQEKPHTDQAEHPGPEAESSKGSFDLGGDRITAAKVLGPL